MRWSVPTLCASSHGMAAPVGKEACSEAWHWLSGDWGLWSRAGARESECARFLWFVCAPLRVRHSMFCSVIHESVGEKGHASCWFLTHTDNEMNQRVATCPDAWQLNNLATPDAADARQRPSSILHLRRRAPQQVLSRLASSVHHVAPCCQAAAGWQGSTRVDFARRAAGSCQAGSRFVTACQRQRVDVQPPAAQSRHTRKCRQSMAGGAVRENLLAQLISCAARQVSALPGYPPIRNPIPASHPNHGVQGSLNFLSFFCKRALASTRACLGDSVLYSTAASRAFAAKAWQRLRANSALSHSPR